MPFSTLSSSPPDQYQSYLIRLWQPGSDGTWRVLLQCVPSGKKISFANLESLNAYLQAQTAVDIVGEATVDGTDNTRP